jgi:hypothetical protein
LGIRLVRLAESCLGHVVFILDVIGAFLGDNAAVGDDSLDGGSLINIGGAEIGIIRIKTGAKDRGALTKTTKGEIKSVKSNGIDAAA